VFCKPRIQKRLVTNCIQSWYHYIRCCHLVGIHFNLWHSAGPWTPFTRGNTDLSMNLRERYILNTTTPEHKHLELFISSKKIHKLLQINNVYNVYGKTCQQGQYPYYINNQPRHILMDVHRYTRRLSLLLI
jgi:hypothetical protein